MKITYNYNKAYCNVLLFGNVAVVQQVSGSKGSITNFIEEIVRNLCQTAGIATSRLMIIEHYPHKGAKTAKEHFKLVTLRNSELRWTDVKKNDLRTYGVDYTQL